jgi:eukaryotic-like serine/threonine-protein kinase
VRSICPDSPLQPGDRLGHYEILSAIGKGGMGEVWKARDTTLQREVAIKSLPEGFALESDRLARLEREATLLAGLNHPNIASIHGLEEHQGTRFLVLELVEGHTLADRLLRGPIPIEQSLKLALQIAEALEAAHEKGVIHRDLKPANIKVTPEGRVKVLDFGLAKALAPASGEGPTQTGLTEAGLIMGTPAYMSPEQARGEAAGRQTDIWSFGVMLYELLTSTSPFGRPTTAETLARLLGTQPDYSVFPSDVPAGARHLVRRCLEKDQKRRLQHMGDVRIEVEDALATLGIAAGQVSEGPERRRRSWLWAAGGIAIAALAALTGWFFAQRSVSAVPAGAVRLSIPFLERPMSQPFGAGHLAISGDGSRVAYASNNRLWIRRMDQKDPIAINVSGTNPFFSPDGAWLGLFRESGLIKVPVDGGSPTLIAMTSDRPGGATWRADGTIVFATTEGLFQVSADGGESRLLVSPDRARKERLYAWPQFMPDGQSILFTLLQEDSRDGGQIALLDLKTLERKILLTGGSSARYVPTGHLLYASGPVLKAIGFDLDKGQVHGEPVSLPEIEIATAADNGASNFAISTTGTLIFTPAAMANTVAPDLRLDLRTLVWIDRQGKEEPLAIEPGRYAYPRISPDGTRVALDIGGGGNRDIWILDLQRLSLTQLTNGPTEDMVPVWSVDGRRIFFASDRTGNHDVYSQAADGATGARVEYAAPGFQAPLSFTPDGTQLIVNELFTDAGILTLARPDRLESLLHSEADERLPYVSPDGNGIVYESDESGQQFEIFLRPFPDVSGGRAKISINGGRYPLWGPKGSGELYYVNLDGDMMAASVTLSPSLKLGKVTKLFNWQKPPNGRSAMVYDVSKVDGRFLVTKPVAQTPDGPTYVSVVLNWTEELRQRVPRR